MRKILYVILSLCLLLSSINPVSFADSWKNGQGGMPPGIAKKFQDTDKYKWAGNAIERMAGKGIIKGMGEGIFAPRKPVTKLEAIVIALRLMGYEDEAQQYSKDIAEGGRKFKFKHDLSGWTCGYAALAQEKGILDDADMLYFKLNDPAARHEVAKYLVRAMGMEDEAKDHMDEDLDYKDASFIPQGSVGYIYVADKEGIIKGYGDGTFRPFNAVTRAEMAVMADRIEGDADESDDEYTTYTGKITEIDDDFKWIELDNTKRFEIEDDTDIIFDDEEGSAEDLDVGDKVKVKLNEDKETVSVRVYEELSDTYKGEIAGIDEKSRQIEFSLYVSASKIVDFKIEEDFKVSFEDEDGTAEDLRIGDKAEVAAEDGEAAKIKVLRDIGEKITDGEIYGVYPEDEKIAIRVDSELKLYSLDDDADIYLNGEAVPLKSLKKGDNVGFRIDDDEVTEIKAYRY